MSTNKLCIPSSRSFQNIKDRRESIIEGFQILGLCTYRQSFLTAFLTFVFGIFEVFTTKTSLPLMSRCSIKITVNKAEHENKCKIFKKLLALLVVSPTDERARSSVYSKTVFLTVGLWAKDLLLVRVDEALHGFREGKRGLGGLVETTLPLFDKAETL